MKNRARFIGACVQGVLLGVLCFFAIVQLLVQVSGARLFDYQGF